MEKPEATVESTADSNNNDLDSSKVNKSPAQHSPPLVITENMIRLRRRFNYASRPRPNALAIVHPETNEVLYPGIKKIEKPISEEPQFVDQVKEEVTVGPTIAIIPPSRQGPQVLYHPETFQFRPIIDPNQADPFHPFYAHYPQPVTYYDLALNSAFFKGTS